MAWWDGLLQGLFQRDQIDGPLIGDELNPIGAFYAQQMQLGSQRLKRYKDFADMSNDTLISGALNIYADEVSQYDRVQGASIWPLAKDPKVQMLLQRMLDKVRVEDYLFGLTRYLACMGDNFVRPLFSSTGGGIVGMEFMDAEDVDRVVDKFNRMVGFRYGGGRKLLDPWAFVHFRLMSRTQSVKLGGGIYGTSMLEDARRTWRQLTLLEDALVIYRLELGGRHRVFYIDVGNAPYDRALRTVRQYRREFGKRQYYNPTTGEYTSRFNPLHLTSDIFWPVRSGSESRIDYMGTDPNISSIVDLEWFRNKLFGALRIPKAYIGGDEYCLSYDTKVYFLDGTFKKIGELADHHANETLWVVAYDTVRKRFVPAKAHSFRKTRVNEPTYRVHLDNGNFLDCSDNERFMRRDGSYCQAKDLKAGESLMPFNLHVDKDGYHLIENPKTTRLFRVHWMVCRELGMLNEHSELVHHDNWVKCDNQPDNLKPMTRSEHNSIHHGERLAEWNRSEAHREQLRQMNLDPEFQAKRQAAAAEGRRKSPKRRAWEKKHGSRILKALRENPEFQAGRTTALVAFNQSEEAKALRQAQIRTRPRDARGRLMSGTNHKVVRVEYIGEQDLYDMEVDEYHNFCTEAGVVVHNSSTRVGLSQIDINFARFIKRLQRAIIVGFYRMGQLHLAVNGVDPLDPNNDFEICMSVISSLDQEQRLMAMDMSLQIAQKLREMGLAMGIDDDAISSYVARHVLGLSPYDLRQVGQEPNKMPSPGQINSGDLNEAVAALRQDPEINRMIGMLQQLTDKAPGALREEGLAMPSQAIDQEPLNNENEHNLSTEEEEELEEGAEIEVEDEIEET